MTACALAGPGNGGVTCVMVDRIDALEQGQGAVLAEVSEVRRTIGVAPDPLKGTPGTGLVGVSYRVAAVVLRGEGAAFASLHEDDEGEITRVQDRAELLGRAKAAEAALRERQRISDRVVEDRAAGRAAQIKLAGMIAGVILALVSLAGNVYLVSRGAAPLPPAQHGAQP